MNIENTDEQQPIDPLTQTGKFYLTARRAFRDEMEARKSKTWRSVFTAIWHGLSVMKAEIEIAMGWPKLK